MNSKNQRKPLLFQLLGALCDSKDFIKHLPVILRRVYFDASDQAEATQERYACPARANSRTASRQRRRVEVHVIVEDGRVMILIQPLSEYDQMFSVPAVLCCGLHYFSLQVDFESWFINEPEKNNELMRTETNSGSMSRIEFVRVRC